MITLLNSNSGGVTVRFTDYDLVHAASVGLYRQSMNLSKSIPDAKGYSGNGWDIHIMGALGEAAVAVYLDRWWSVGVMKGTDVSKYQVRTTGYSHGCLLLHPSDDNDSIFFLVTAFRNQLTIRGWITGQSGKRKEWWDHSGNGRSGAFFVPQSALWSLAEFVKETTV